VPDSLQHLREIREPVMVLLALGCDAGHPVADDRDDFLDRSLTGIDEIAEILELAPER
jgi:hypothetical protein